MTMCEATETPLPSVHLNNMKPNNNNNNNSSSNTNTMMSELFQRSLGIRENGCCYRHPDVVIMEVGAKSLRSCHLCAMDKQQQSRELHRDDTASTAGMSQPNDFFWSSEASLSLMSGLRRGGGGGNGGNAADNADGGSDGRGTQASGEENSETESKQQQEKFFESLVSRWVQVQDSTLQQSIALSTPLILQEMRKLENRVNQQSEIIQQQQETIISLKKTIENKHDSTQEMLSTILKKIEKGGFTSGAGAAAKGGVGVGRNHNGKLSSSNRQRTSGGGGAGGGNGASDMNSIRSNTRSIDSRVRQPMTRHDSNRSFAVSSVVSRASTFKPIYHTMEINLDGSGRSFSERPKLAKGTVPDMADLFEDGMGGTIVSAKKKKFKIPAVYAAQQRAAKQRALAGPKMEIILENGGGGSNKNNSSSPAVDPISERKLIPNSPEEMGMDMGESLKGNAKAFIEKAPSMKKVGSSKTNNGTDGAVVKGTSTHPDDQSEVRLSCVTLDAASAASELSDSDSESSLDSEDEGTLEDGEFYVDGGPVESRSHNDDEETDVGDDHTFDDEGEEESKRTAPSWVDSMVDAMDDDTAEFDIDDLQHVSRFKMIDMYGDRGTYTGTLGPDNDPTGFGTMKYESGRFYKGEWKKGRWNGKGTLLNANGDSYQGDFVSDARHGRGVYRFTSGDVYEGDFFEDNRHGKGKFKFHNGSVYTGDFCMGSFEGQGRYDFEGGYYEGSWKRDEYYGRGKLQYKDGSNYTGKFKRGSAHGFGEERLADGTVRCGLWKRGEFLQECSEEECKRLESMRSNSAKKNRSSHNV